MDSGLIVDLWNTFKESVDKKQVETVAERFVDVCADYGADDVHFRDAMGTFDFLDAAITYYLDDVVEDYDDEADDWDDD